MFFEKIMGPWIKTRILTALSKIKNSQTLGKGPPEAGLAKVLTGPCAQEHTLSSTLEDSLREASPQTGHSAVFPR